MKFRVLFISTFLFSTHSFAQGPYFSSQGAVGIHSEATGKEVSITGNAAATLFNQLKGKQILKEGDRHIRARTGRNILCTADISGGTDRDIQENEVESSQARCWLSIDENGHVDPLQFLLGKSAD